MTSFDVAAALSELRGVVRDARIRNIYQLDHTIILKLHKPSQPSLLLIEAGRRIHLTSYSPQKPARPPTFCMALRKYLRNGRVVDIFQHEFERTVILKVQTRLGEFQLVCELFGGGNIILADQEGTILHALIHRRMRDRDILPGKPLQHAPPSGRNPITLSREELGEIRSLGELEVVRGLTRLLSIGGLYAEEILLRAGIDKGRPCKDLTEDELDRIFHGLRDILHSLSPEGLNPQLVVDEDGNWIDVVPIPLKRYSRYRLVPKNSFNEALDEYYMRVDLAAKVEEERRRLEQELERNRRILQQQEKALKELRERIDRNRRIGELIYQHLGELQLLRERILAEREAGKGWAEIATELREEGERGVNPAIYFHSLDPKNLVLHVRVEGFTFPISLKDTVQANASRYYERAKRDERKLRGVEEAIRNTEEKLRQLQERHVKLVEEEHKPPPKTRRKAWYEKFRWFISSDGFLVLGGKDATTNEILIKRHMEPHDIVLHADIPGAPFVLIKTGGEKPPERTILEAAQLAASYSRAWRAGLRSVNVYWVFPEQVSKHPPSGQYLRKGAFVIRGSKNYVRNVPLRVAVGVEELDGELRVIGGPVEPISRRAVGYVELVPGDQPSGRLARQIRRLLSDRVPEGLKERVLALPLEDIQHFIPAGRGSITPHRSSAYF